RWPGLPAPAVRRRHGGWPVKTLTAAHRTPGRHARRGLALVELVMALAVVGFVGLGVVGVFWTLSVGTRDQNESRQRTVQHRTVADRLGDALRCAAVFLHADDDQLVFWRGDLDGNGQPSVS